MYETAILDISKGRAKPQGHRLQHNPPPSTQSCEITSNNNSTIYLPNDEWDKKYPFSYAAIWRRL
jgi:hypothetical protein